MKKKFARITWLPVMLCFIFIFSSVIFAAESHLNNDYFSNSDLLLTDEDMPAVSDSITFGEPVIDFSTEPVIPKGSDTSLYNSKKSNIQDELDQILYDGQTFTEYRAKNQQMDIENFTITFDDGKTIEFDDSVRSRTSRIYDIGDYIKTTSQSALRAKAPSGPQLPDYFVDDLEITTPPFSPNQALVDSHVEFYLRNYGPANIGSVDIEFEEDSYFLFGIELRSFPGYQGATISFDFRKGFKYGTYPVEVKADPSGKIMEANENNNGYTANFTFNGKPAMEIFNFEAEGDTDDVVTLETIKFNYVMRNAGNAPAYNKEISLLINGTQVKTYRIPSIAPHVSIPGEIYITFKKKGDYSLVLRMDSQNYPSCDIAIGFDIERFAGSWPDANDLEVKIHEDVTNLYSRADLEHYEDWNSINSNVNFLEFESVQDAPVPVDECDFYVFTEELNKPNVLGDTAIYKNPSLFGWGNVIYEIPDEDLLTDDSDYVFVTVWLSPTLTAQKARCTITHEFGHGLGLAHSECFDKAIMRRAYDSDYHSKTIASHDIQNLNAVY